MQPSELQSKASNPNQSVWVSASAGSGKTKVLTDRVLRLLLAGTLPSKILCITYTKAGAAEMRGRIDKRLGEWVMMEEAALISSLHALTGINPGKEMLALARQLFARVIEDEVGLRIQTIHAFCQSLLTRFPVEAGVPPHFRLIENEASAHLLTEAKSMLASGGMSADTPELISAIKKMARSGNEWGFDELLGALVQRRKEFGALLYSSPRREEVDIFALCGVPPHIRDATALREWCAFSESELADLRQLCAWALEGSKNDVKCHAAIAAFLKRETPSFEDYAALSSVFFTEKGKPRDTILTVGLQKKYPSAAPVIHRLTLRIGGIRSAWLAFRTAERSQAAAVIAQALYEAYASLKRGRAGLDYDDLIFKARELLTGEQALGWVMYKLDGGIEHVLVDEAQDTSREQWEITAALTGEFFSGHGARGAARTLFVVGDAKQSIFRFQGAYPEGFFAFREYFQQKAALAEMPFAAVPMTTSFRSSPAILKMVDAVFADGLGEYYEAHRAFHAALPGRIEVWPLYESDQKEAQPSWRAPRIPEERTRSEVRLAERIANTISGWLKERRILPATGKPVRPRDIMILSRRREPMASALLAALRKQGVPSTGLDRLALTEDIAVKDMLALGQFLLMPGDDFALAALLKSPLYDVSEETLFQLCFARHRESVWRCVQVYHGPDEKVRAAGKELQELLNLTDFVSPYRLYADVLQARDGMRRMVARLGEHVREVLEAFLNEALLYEENETPSLQGFCHWLGLSGREVKREQEQKADEVRILTVHGAKGLEAPVVFLTDTTLLPDVRGADRLVADEEHGLIVSLPPKSEDIPLTEKLRDTAERQVYEEYQRLLYVALTRAKHELYICGALNARQKQAPAGSWYDMARRGFERLSGETGDEVMVYAETGEEKMQEENDGVGVAGIALPGCFRTNPPEENVATRHNPSHLEEEAGEIVPFARLAPLERKLRAERGNVIHRLLEILPNVAPEGRRGIGLKIAERHAPRRKAQEREQWVEAVVVLMRDETFSRVFGPHALAEVPVAGKLKDGRHVTGQIDRLVIEDDTVLIIDFKTGKPDKNQPVPKKYRAQMQAYADLMRQRYPAKKIQSGLLFTEIPEILWVQEQEE